MILFQWNNFIPVEWIHSTGINSFQWIEFIPVEWFNSSRIVKNSALRKKLLRKLNLNNSILVESFQWNEIILLEWIWTKPTCHPGAPCFVLWKSLNLNTFEYCSMISQKSHLHIAVKNRKYPHIWHFYFFNAEFFFHWNEIIQLE